MHNCRKTSNTYFFSQLVLSPEDVVFKLPDPTFHGGTALVGVGTLRLERINMFVKPELRLMLL